MQEGPERTAGAEPCRVGLPNEGNLKEQDSFSSCVAVHLSLLGMIPHLVPGIAILAPNSMVGI